MKAYGGKIEGLFLKLITAIKDKEIVIQKPNKYERIGIQKLKIEKTSFTSWAIKHRDTEELVSLPTLAKTLGINQQFAYQLVKERYLKPGVNKKSSNVYFSEGDIFAFTKEYVILSKLSKASGINSRHIIRYLASKQIYSVGSDLRQKLYRRLDLNNVGLFKDIIMNNLDWSYMP